MHYFEIRLKGQLDQSWSQWLEGLSITYEGTELTVLQGTLPDQAALFGILLKIRDLGLELLCLKSRPVVEYRQS
jgi:hypothetical protein